MKKLIDKLFKKFGYTRIDDFWHHVIVRNEIKKGGNQYGKWRKSIVSFFINGILLYSINLDREITISKWRRLDNGSEDELTIFNRPLTKKEVNKIAKENSSIYKDKTLSTYFKFTQ